MGFVRLWVVSGFLCALIFTVDQCAGAAKELLNKSDPSSLASLASVVLKTKNKAALDKFWSDEFARCKTAKEESNLFVAQAILASQLGQTAQGLQSARFSISKDPENSEGYYWLGTFYFRAHLFEKAAAEFFKALKLNPDSELALSGAADSSATMGQLEEAVSLYGKLILRNSGNAYYFLSRGNAYQLLGEFQNAMNDYNKAVEIEPRLSKSYILIGTLMRRQGKLSEALSNFDRGIAISGTPNAFLSRGLLFLELKKYKEAERDFSKVIAYRDENTPAAYHGRAKARQALGQVQLAEMDLRTADILVSQLLPMFEGKIEEGKKSK